MAYLYSKGKRVFGDITFEDDTNTQIDFEDDYIGLVASGSTVLAVSGSKVGIGTTAPEAYLDIKNTADDGTTNRTMIRLHNYRDDDANVNDWAPTSIDFEIENVAGGVKGATARIAAVLAPEGTNHNSTEGEQSSALMFSTMDDDTLSEAMRINHKGSVGIGTGNPTDSLDINSDSIRIRTNKTPSSASDTGDAGRICWDSNYIYICIATNTWKRVAIASW